MNAKEPYIDLTKALEHPSKVDFSDRKRFDISDAVGFIYYTLKSGTFPPDVAGLHEKLKSKSDTFDHGTQGDLYVHAYTFVGVFDSCTVHLRTKQKQLVNITIFGLSEAKYSEVVSVLNEDYYIEVGYMGGYCFYSEFASKYILSIMPSPNSIDERVVTIWDSDELA